MRTIIAFLLMAATAMGHPGGRTSSSKHFYNVRRTHAGQRHPARILHE